MMKHLAKAGISSLFLLQMLFMLISNLKLRQESSDEMAEQIARLEDHYILCGSGRTGSHIVEAFSKIQIPFVIIDQNPVALRLLRGQIRADLLYLEGDATEDNILQAARIEHATGLITTLPEDKDNLFVVLSARSLAPNLRIVAKVNDEEKNAAKLRQAGADVIVSPNAVGGLRMASEMIRPEVVTFLDQMMRVSEEEKRLHFTEIHMDELTLASDKVRIADIRRHTGLLVVAIKSDGKYQYKPNGSVELHRSTETQSGDVLIVVGTQEQLSKARKDT